MNRLILFTLLIILSGCGSFVQITTYRSDELTFNGDSYRYRDDVITIDYTFNNDGAIFDFIVTNNSDKDIYIITNKSYFVYNGNVYDYAGKSITLSQHEVIISDITSNIGIISGSSISSTHEIGDQLVIPSGCHRIFQSADRHRYLFYDAYIIKGIVNRDNTSIICDKEDSPVKMINSVTYLHDGTEYQVNNELYLQNIETQYFKADELNVIDKFIESNQMYKKIYIYYPNMPEASILTSDEWIKLN
jgi:hypothetical protein